MDIHLVQDNESPQKSANSDLVAAWLTAGGQLIKRGGYQDYESEGKRCVQWLVNGDVQATIDGEQIKFPEFRKRFESLDWCMDHPNSDISWMRGFRDNARDLKRFAKTVVTGIRRTDGNTSGILYPNSPDWLKEEFATRFL